MGSVTSTTSEDYALDTVRRLSLRRDDVKQIEQLAKDKMKKDRHQAKQMRASQKNLLSGLPLKAPVALTDEAEAGDDRPDEPNIFTGATPAEQLANYKKGIAEWREWAVLEARAQADLDHPRKLVELQRATSEDEVSRDRKSVV